MQLDLGGLPGPAGQAPRGQQQPHRLFQGVVAALPVAAVILGARLLPQGVQDLLHGGQALGGQVPVGTAAALEQPGHPEPAVPEPGVLVLVPVRAARPRGHLLGRLGQVVQVPAADRQVTRICSPASRRSRGSRCSHSQIFRAYDVEIVPAANAAARRG